MENELTAAERFEQLSEPKKKVFIALVNASNDNSTPAERSYLRTAFNVRDDRELVRIGIELGVLRAPDEAALKTLRAGYTQLRRLEKDRFYWLRDGEPDEQLADRLNMRQDALRACVARIKYRLGLGTRADIMRATVALRDELKADGYTVEAVFAPAPPVEPPSLEPAPVPPPKPKLPSPQPAVQKSPPAPQKPLSLKEKFDALSPKQQAVFIALVNLPTYPDVAEELSVSLNTVKDHQFIIHKKFEVHDKCELVRFGIELGLVRAPDEAEINRLRAGYAELTDTEKERFCQLQYGQSDKLFAQELGITTHAVHSCVAGIRGRLGLKTREDIIRATAALHRELEADGYTVEIVFPSVPPPAAELAVALPDDGALPYVRVAAVTHTGQARSTTPGKVV